MVDYYLTQEESNYCHRQWTEFTTLTSEEISNLEKLTCKFHHRIWDNRTGHIFQSKNDVLEKFDISEKELEKHLLGKVDYPRFKYLKD